MPTIVNFTIKKDGSGDFTSLKAAIIAEGKDLVAADELHRFAIFGAGWDSATPLSETFIDFNAYPNTDATRRVELIVEVDDRHDFTGGTGFVFTIPSSFGFVLRSKFVTIDGFEISNTIGTSGVFNNADSINTLLKNTIMFNIAGGGAFQGDGENNIHWGYTGQSGNLNLFYLNGTATNVTCIQKAGEGGFFGDIGIRSVDCENVMLYSDDGTGLDQYFSCTGDYNAANQADSNPPGANSFDTVVTGDFVNFAGLDYRSALGGALETSGLAGTFIGGALEVSSGISIAVDSALPSLSSSLSLSKIDNSFSIDVNSTLPSLSSSLNLTSTDNIFDLSVSSELPSLTSILSLSVVNPGNSASINSFLPSLVSSLNLTKTDPATGVLINSELPSLISSLSLSVTNPEFDFSVVSILPSLSSSLSLYNGVLGISVGDRNNINIVVKSTNINVITKSRNIEEY